MFLNSSLSFSDLPLLIERAMELHKTMYNPTLKIFFGRSGNQRSNKGMVFYDNHIIALLFSVFLL